MNTKLLKSIFLVVSLVIYDYFFWQEKFGINLMLFTALLSAFIILQNKESLQSINVLVLLSGVLISGAMVFINNSGISKFTHILSFLLLTGFVHEQKMRSLYFTFANVFLNFSSSPIMLFKSAEKTTINIKGVRLFFFWSKILFFPILIIVVFYMLYAGSNQFFGSVFEGLWSFLDKIFRDLFQNLSIARTLFLLIGLLIISGVIIKKYFSYFLSDDLSYSDFIRREKMNREINKKRNSFQPFTLNALRKELKAGIVLLVILNFLILVLNFIDIKMLWFGFYPPDQFSMKHFVHEGTYLLIISILFSMVIILYFFRKNQNFISQNKLLKLLSYAWIFQNMILCISVCIRNQYYVYFDGLAYKRIGLFAFLLLVLFGLSTLMHKIKKLKSFYYLLRINTWSIYIMIMIMSFFNWDMIIAKTNINHQNDSGIDLDLYLYLSPLTYPYIYANLNKIEKQMEQHKATGVKWVKNLDIKLFKQALDLKRDEFLSRYADYSWVSWNSPDQRAFNKLTAPENKNLTLKK